MKAKLIGMSAYQGTPVSGTLRIYRAGRYEDGQGNAAVRLEEFKWRAGTAGARGSWGDPFNPAVDAYTIVSAAGEPAPVEGLFEEVFTYSDGSERRSLYRKNLIATNLAGTEFDYTEPQGVTTYSGSEPLTFQAARDLLTEGTTKLAEMEQALADNAQAQAANDEQQAQNNTTTAAALAEIQGIQARAYTTPIYVGSVSVSAAMVDANDNAYLYFGTDGKTYLPADASVAGALTVGSLNVLSALSLAAATIGTINTTPDTAPLYLSGVQVAKSLAEDSAGTPALAIGVDGRILAPGGIVAPNIGSMEGMTRLSSGVWRINGALMVPKLDAITCIGDSLTAGAGGTPYPTQLTALLPGRTITTNAIGGQGAQDIAARIVGGGFTVAGNSIPASGGVSVTRIGHNMLGAGGDGTYSRTGALHGVPGTMTCVTSGGTYTYTFTRTTAGSATATPTSAWFSPDIDTETLPILWVGRNNAFATTMAEDVRTAMRQIVSRFAQVGVQRALVLSLLEATTDDQAARDRIRATNRMLGAEYPNWYVDTHLWLGASDMTPPELLVDNVHLNTTGYGLIAQGAAGEITRRGW
ncbi:hypothetical protein [Deinococcus sp. ME38]|uniref:hypothetical protein n=1 Tax=Deinococcus sp. ME38 TaxID=3400344 RepID=UPI003B5A6BEF